MPKAPPGRAHRRQQPPRAAKNGSRNNHLGGRKEHNNSKRGGGSHRRAEETVSNAAAQHHHQQHEHHSNSNDPNRTPDGSHPDDYIYFWKPEQENGWASQWHEEPFEGPTRIANEPELTEGEDATAWFYTAENWMMFHKAVLFGDHHTAKLILEEPSPHHVKKLGREVQGFDEDVWTDMRYDFVLEGTKAKFRSSPSLRQRLLETGSKILVEASPFDRIWGVGFGKNSAFDNQPRWGLNLLGQALMEVRTILRQEENHTVD